MKELFDFTFSSVNIIPTVLLIFVALYWLAVLIGIIDMGSIDLDVDIDADVDLDVDADIDADVSSTGGNVGLAMQSLIFFNIGKVPLLILLSFVAIPFWMLSIIVNYYLNIDNFAFALLLHLPEFLISLFIAKFATQPIAKLFKKMDDKFGKGINYIGKTAIARFEIENNKDSQIEIDLNNTTNVLTARSYAGKINKGDKVLIIEHNKKDGYYIVEPFEL